MKGYVQIFLIYRDLAVKTCLPVVVTVEGLRVGGVRRRHVGGGSAVVINIFLGRSELKGDGHRGDVHHVVEDFLCTQRSFHHQCREAFCQEQDERFGCPLMLFNNELVEINFIMNSK